MKKFWIAFTMLIVICLSTATAVYYYNKPVAGVEKKSADYSIEAKDLVAAFTSDESQANQKYVDHVVEVSGVIKSINTSSQGEVSVTLDAGNEMSNVVCQLEQSDDKNLAALKEGEDVTLKGVCSGALIDVVMVQCIKI